MKRLLILMIFLFTGYSCFAYNPFWLHKDKKLISALVRLDKHNPAEVELYFKKQLGKDSLVRFNMGFGWAVSTPSVGGGYINLSATFFYFHDSIVGYKLKGQLPEETGLHGRYKKWYNGYFNFDGNELQAHYLFNDAAVWAPLPQYKGECKNISPRFITYMMPEPSDVYGGWQTTRRFLEIKDSLTADQFALLLYSKNPTTRLTAVDYYLKNSQLFADQETIDNWIETVINEIPEIVVRQGCFLMREKTENLFPLYLMRKYYKNARYNRAVDPL